MKLMSPWRYSSTFFERCFATSEKPSFSNSGSSVAGHGRREFDELEAHQPHRVVIQVGAGGGRRGDVGGGGVAHGNTP
jgi:hypothetical protein